MTKLFYILSTSYANLNNDFNSLKKNLIDLKNKITSDSMKKQFWLRFSVNITSFCKQARKINNFLFYSKIFSLKIEKLSELWNKIEHHKQDLIEYYCEDVLTFNFDDFLKIFHDFCRNVVRAREVIKNILLKIKIII